MKLYSCCPEKRETINGLCLLVSGTGGGSAPSWAKVPLCNGVSTPVPKPSDQTADAASITGPPKVWNFRNDFPNMSVETTI